MAGASIDAARIRAEAVEGAGIEDSEAALFDRNLDMFAKSVNEESDLTEEGAREVHAESVLAVKNRLEGLRWTRDNPEILDERIDNPIILTGLPRSGTTFFQYLFDRDPDLRLIRTWERLNPSPPPAVAPETIPARIEYAVARCQHKRDQVKEFDAIHLQDPEGSDECHEFLGQTFSAIGYHNYLNVPSFVDYLFSELDLGAGYRVHRRQLQLLQWKAPKRRWALKYPNHLIAMNEIVDTYPDATFVMTHRDPVQTLASLCSLTEKFRAVRMRTLNMDEIGPQMLDFVSRHLDRLMAFSDRQEGQKRIISVDYYRLTAAPAEELAKVYQGLGIDMPEPVRRNVAEWHVNNPKGKRGKFSYALESFGLDADEVAERFKPYMDRFNVRREAEGLLERA